MYARASAKLNEINEVTTAARACRVSSTHISLKYCSDIIEVPVQDFCWVLLHSLRLQSPIFPGYHQASPDAIAKLRNMGIGIYIVVIDFKQNRVV